MSAANRPQGIEIATLTTFDIPALAVLTLEAYDDAVTPEALLETSEELRLTFEGAFGDTTEDSFVGAWDGGTLVGAILVVRGVPIVLMEHFHGSIERVGWTDATRIGLYGATGLPIIVAVTELGVSTGVLPAWLESLLVVAGALSVLFFPLVAFLMGRAVGKQA